MRKPRVGEAIRLVGVRDPRRGAERPKDYGTTGFETGSRYGSKMRMEKANAVVVEQKNDRDDGR